MLNKVKKEVIVIHGENRIIIKFNKILIICFLILKKEI
jgi:hypothetical protein